MEELLKRTELKKLSGEVKEWIDSIYQFDEFEGKYKIKSDISSIQNKVIELVNKAYQAGVKDSPCIDCLWEAKQLCKKHTTEN